MSDNPLIEPAVKTGGMFPLVIAVTALVIAVTSGIVNYRQNNLTALESSLRDTRDQLQLAKNDITDIKMNTVKQLVDAEFAVKNQRKLKEENAQMSERLADARRRIGELEGQIRRMDDQLVSARARLKSSRKKVAAKRAPTKLKKVTIAASKSQASPAAPALNRSANLDIYTVKIAPSLQQQIGKQIAGHGFVPKFPALPASMRMTTTTTVFYYGAHYRGVAENLAKALTGITHSKVLIRKGASPYPVNKIIAHIIGS